MKNVDLKAAGDVFYHKAGPWRGLTLLLPQNEPGKPYELSVDGRPPVKFQAGLQPFRSGASPGNRHSPQCRHRWRRAQNHRPQSHQTRRVSEPEGMGRRSRRPRKTAAPRAIFRESCRAPALPWHPDAVFAPDHLRGSAPAWNERRVFCQRHETRGVCQIRRRSGFRHHLRSRVCAARAPPTRKALNGAARNLPGRACALGLQYDQNWNRPSLQHPNLAFLAHTLPDWHGPLYRSVSLATQRFARMPNFAGLNIGSDNAGYASYWNWAPPIPDRPWGEGMIAFFGSPQPKVPRAPSLGPVEAAFEVPVKRPKVEFTRYVEHYADTSFREYALLRRCAIREVDPLHHFYHRLVWKLPGRRRWSRRLAVGGSIPARVIFEDLTTQQAATIGIGRRIASKPSP